MNYIKQIINLFFQTKEVSCDIKNKVYHRLVVPKEDEMRDEVLEKIWNEIACEEKYSKDWEKSFNEIEYRLGKVSNKQIYSIRWKQIAAIWLLPFLMLCTSGYWFFSKSDESEKIKFPISYLQHYAALGTKEKLVLPDSSEVWLNAGSTLIYPSTFASSEREIHLVGEAFFDVKKDSLHPFIVNTHYLKIQVLGTSFNVSAYPDALQVEATLERGALKINVLNDSVSYFLSPDNQLVYIPSSRQVKQQDVKASNYSEWRNGGLFFNDVSFEDILREIERSYGVTIFVRNSLYNTQRLYIHFNKDESLETIFRILGIMVPGLDYKIEGENIYIE